MYLGSLLFVACLLFAIPAHALSVDLSAMSSTHTRQAVAAARHIQQYDAAQFEVSGQYAATQGKTATWDAGIENVYELAYGLRTESDFRYFHNRSTFSGAAGIGIRFLSLSGGFRTEYLNSGGRDTFGKVTVTSRGKRGNVSVSAKVERLLGGASRTDYRAEARYQVRRFYVGFKFEELRHAKLQAVGLGVSF